MIILHDVTLLGIITILQCCRGFDLTILHTNDVHARFEQFNQFGSFCSDEDAAAGECFGGVPRRVTKIEEIRDQSTLLLDAGDQFQGTQWFYHFQGKATSHFMNWMGYQAMCLGNHEFDNGVEGLVDFLRSVSFPVLSCNIDASAEPEFESLFQKSVILDVAGERIGIIGYTFSKTPEISNPGRNLVFLDEVPSIQAEVDRLTAAGIDKIIALGHSGYDRDIEIAKSTVGIDVIVGGHSNTFLHTGTPPTNDPVEGPYPTVVTPDGAPNDRVLIVHDFAGAKYLGFLQVAFDDNGKVASYDGNPILLDDGVKQDEATLTEINEWAIPIRALTTRVVGETYVLLQGAPTCLMEECTMGDLIADAMLENLVSPQSDESWSDVAVSILNGGGVRTSVAQGMVTFGDVTTVLPFAGTFDLFDLKGRYLLEALENSVQYYGDPALSGRFLQMSGIIVTYNLEMPPGERVVSAEIRCTACKVPDYEPLDVERTYRIVAPSYIVAGGDGYTMISENLQNLLTGDLDSGVLSDYITKHSPIIQGRERRIVFTNTTATSSGNRSFSLLSGLLISTSIAYLNL